MGLMTPPPRFVDQLKAYDGELSVRWGDREGCWYIERHSHTPAILPAPDRKEPYKELILRVPRESLDNRVFYTLFVGDIHRRGGYAMVADEEERKELDKQVKQREAFLDRIDQEARQRYTYWNSPHTLPAKYAHTATDLSLSLGV